MKIRNRNAARWATILFLTALAFVTALAKEQWQMIRLDNGMQVIVIENRSVPLVTVEIAVKNGSYTETPEYNGLSHLYEHMFFK
ncbi:MAG: insulinase family protein, partial [Acidobacteria bacterium]|nr:insulinase family protein [Acidobacteriota bacterium]